MVFIISILCNDLSFFSSTMRLNFRCISGVFVCKHFLRISKNLGSLCAKETNKELKVHLTGHGERVVYAAESLHGIQTSNSCQEQSFLARSMNLFGESQKSLIGSLLCIWNYPCRPTQNGRNQIQNNKEKTNNLIH